MSEEEEQSRPPPAKVTVPPPKPYSESFALPARVLHDDDWRWVDLISSPQSEGGKKPRDERPLSQIFYYEYARESPVLRRWAKIEALNPDYEEPEAARSEYNDARDKHPEHDAINDRLQKLKVEGLYPFLWALRKELATDTPWLRIESARWAAALKARVGSAPTVFMLGYDNRLRPADSFEIESKGLVVRFGDDDEEDGDETDPVAKGENLTPLSPEEIAATEEEKKFWQEEMEKQHRHAFGRIALKAHWVPGKRAPQEVIALRIDWENTRNEELADLLKDYRPDLEKAKEPKRPDGAGQNKASDYRAWLRALAVLRLQRHFKDIDARDHAFDLGVSRSDVFDRDVGVAKEMFRARFCEIDGGEPLSAPSLLNAG